MFAMFGSFFRMFEKLFSAGEKGASALDHLGRSAEQSAAAYADQKEMERKAQMAQLNKQLTQIKAS